MKDLNKVADIIRNDIYILKALQIENKVRSEIEKRIMTRKNYADELTGTTSYINIYYAPSRKAQNTSYTDNVIQIDVLFPYSKSNTAQNVISKIETVLYDIQINGRYLDIDVTPYDNSTGAKYYTISMRFNIYKPKGYNI